jgi:hypothetical protein
MIYSFWLVWCPEGRYPPKFEHGTKLKAEKEAVRLAEKYPGKEFYVMECSGMACRIGDKTLYAESENHELLPFTRPGAQD